MIHRRIHTGEKVRSRMKQNFPMFHVEFVCFLSSGMNVCLCLFFFCELICSNIDATSAIRRFVRALIYKYIAKYTQVGFNLILVHNLCQTENFNLVLGEKPFVCTTCGKRFRVRGDLKRHSNIHERNNKLSDTKLDEMSNGSSNDNNKNELFIMDDTNNTIQSRSTDTLDQLVSVIESTDAALSNTDSRRGNSSNSSSSDSNLLKKRNFMHIGYEKSFSKTKFKRDFRTFDVADDCSSSAILDYSVSADHLMDKEIAFVKTRIRHDA